MVTTSPTATGRDAASRACRKTSNSPKRRSSAPSRTAAAPRTDATRVQTNKRHGTPRRKPDQCKRLMPQASRADQPARRWPSRSGRRPGRRPYRRIAHASHVWMRTPGCDTGGRWVLGYRPCGQRRGWCAVCAGPRAGGVQPGRRGGRAAPGLPAALVRPASWPRGSTAGMGPEPCRGGCGSSWRRGWPARRAARRGRSRLCPPADRVPGKTVNRVRLGARRFPSPAARPGWRLAGSFPGRYEVTGSGLDTRGARDGIGLPGRSRCGVVCDVRPWRGRCPGGAGCKVRGVSGSPGARAGMRGWRGVPGAPRRGRAAASCTGEEMP